MFSAVVKGSSGGGSLGSRGFVTSWMSERESCRKLQDFDLFWPLYAETMFKVPVACSCL
jgi:hypothetical protein